MLCQPPLYFPSIVRRGWGGIKLKIGICLQILKCSDNHCKYRLRLSLRGRFARGNLFRKGQDCFVSLAMTILIAGFGKLFTILWFGRSQWCVLLKQPELLLTN